MMHQCQDCGTFFNPGQNSDMTQDGCPQCGRPYHTQPGGIPDESNEMLHGLQSMPTSTQDDMSGNPLQEGMLGGWKNRQVRDESFASVRHAVSLFETPEFETTGLVAPPGLYRDGMEAEAAHRADVRLPHGVTENLHTALGNLGAWAANPYENGELRPYKDYWSVIRPSPLSSLQIGVADPTMAEIINHVAQTDDLTPLYEYRGKTSAVKTAGPLLGLLPEGAAALLGGGAAAGAADAAGAGAAEAAGAAAAGTAGAGVGDAAAGAAAADSAGASASGLGGLWKKVIGPAQGVLNNPGVQTVRGIGQLGQGLNYVDDFLGAGGAGGAGGGAGGGGGGPVYDTSFYARTASDEDDAFPNVHGEIPKNDDGDPHQQSDGNHHEWQRDISVDHGGGGAFHAPGAEPGGSQLGSIEQLLPLLEQVLGGGEKDPMLDALHEALEAKSPGYLDGDDDSVGRQLVMILTPEQVSEPKDTHEPGQTNDADHTDENAGGKRESKVAWLHGEAADFLPDFEVTLPALNGSRTADAMPMGGPGGPMAGPPMAPPSPMSGPSPMPATPPSSPPVSQGPTTDEQQAWFANWLLEHDRADDIPKMISDPQPFAKDFALARGQEVPPQMTGDSMSAEPPMPAQEEAPPEDTMPVPGMSAQMMSAVQRYAADSVAEKCPECGSHTTEMLNDDGDSRCHACERHFKTKGKVPSKIKSDASRHRSDEHTFNLDSGDQSHSDQAVQGVPAAEQHKQRDIRQEQDSSHTWLDSDGAPLQVGNEYEMYSSKYDIPDLIRIDGVKPDAIHYTITGEFGLDHSTELTKQEANIEQVSFEPSITGGEFGPGDQGSLEENNDDNTQYTGTPEKTDLSAPTGLVSASVKPHLAWLEPAKFEHHTAGANFTPMEQRALIDEQGAARNGDLLSLEHTHYVQDADDDQFLFGL